MCELKEVADAIREHEANGRFDLRAIAEGLKDASDVCSPEQSALKVRLEVAANALKHAARTICEVSGSLKGAAIVMESHGLIRNAEISRDLAAMALKSIGVSA